MHILRGIIGLFFLLLLAFLLSRDRSKIDWKEVGKSLCLQFLLALLVGYVPAIRSLLLWLTQGLIYLLSFAQEGLLFLFGDFVKQSGGGSVFALRVLPSILFFSALMSVLYYFNLIQRLIRGLHYLFRHVFLLSGAEGTVLAANLFVGIGEIPILVKGRLAKMTSSELFLLMTAGMSTVAGGAFVGYMNMIHRISADDQLLFMQHLVTAMIMALPGALAIARIIYPQENKIHSEELFLDEESHRHSNLLDALAQGTSQGVRLVVNIAAMLFVFISMIAMLNELLLRWVGAPLQLNQWVSDLFGEAHNRFDFQFLLGLLFSPFAWLLGVPVADILHVGQLLGEKIVTNEFVGYQSLLELRMAGLFVEEKSFIMSVYLLCSFANISSMAIMIASVGTLAPGHRPFLTRYAWLAVCAGTLVPCLSATMAGLLL